MGCDGGTIPRRDELVKTKKKPEEKDKQADSIGKWKYCSLSSEKLRKPIVSCELGRLYNKEAIIHYLLEKDTNPNAIVKHVRSLKDVKELNLTEKFNYEERTVENGQYVDILDSKFICPVVGLEMNGKYKFCYLRECGCVLSERALREVRSDVCHKCDKPYDEQDIIIINGTEEEIKQQKAKMEERRAKEKLEKKAKKRKNEEDSKEGVKEAKKCSTSTSSVGTSITSTSSKTSDPSSLKTTKNSTSILLTDKAKSSYSVAKDESASEVYKSIFTSHKSAKNKPKAHWVTFNPLYF
jgi:hypothetical protein